MSSEFGLTGNNCSGCGYIHPAPIGDNCPVNKVKKLGNDLKTKRIYDFTTQLTEFLIDSADDNYKQHIENIKKLLKI